jgi:hypothetical protein
MQPLPRHNLFLQISPPSYTLKGVSVGDDEKVVGTNQVGWLDKYSDTDKAN